MSNLTGSFCNETRQHATLKSREFVLIAPQVTHISQKSWSIAKFITFCLFRSISDDELDEFVVVLRNSPTAFCKFGISYLTSHDYAQLLTYHSTATSWKFFKLRKRKRGPELRQSCFIYSVILIGIIHASAYIGLGVFMPLTLIDNFAKLKNVNCGYWPVNISDLGNISDENDRRFVLSQFAGFVAKGTATTKGYVSECYGAFPASNCDLLLNSRIAWTGVDNISCPFAPGQCVGGDTSAYTMAMKNITAADYGINIKSTLSMSRNATCAPVIMEPYRCDNDHGGQGYCHFTYYGNNHSTPVRMDEANASVLLHQVITVF